MNTNAVHFLHGIQAGRLVSPRDAARSVLRTQEIELNIESTRQASHTCPVCATITGRFVCRADDHKCNHWRHSEPGLYIIVSVVERGVDGSARLLAYLLTEDQGIPHARAVYYSEPLEPGRTEGRWSLSLKSDEPECRFLFPEKIEVTVGSPASPSQR